MFIHSIILTIVENLVIAELIVIIYINLRILYNKKSISDNFLLSRANTHFIKELKKHIVIFLLSISYFITFSLLDNYSQDMAESNNESIPNRIIELSNNLKEISDELMIIQQELEDRIEYVENLQKEAEIAENMLSLSEEQVNAIQIKLNQELYTSNNKNTLTSILISTFFFLLGLAVPQIIKLIRKKQPANNNLNSNKYSKEELISIFEDVVASLEKDNE